MSNKEESGKLVEPDFCAFGDIPETCTCSWIAGPDPNNPCVGCPYAVTLASDADLPELAENQIQEIEERADRWYAGLM